jgi:hypothetical protein
MSLRPSFKLSLPVVALALLIAFAAWPGMGAPQVEAAVSGISVNSHLGGDGDSITVTVTGTNTDSPLNVTNTSDETFTVVSCDDLGDAGANDCDTPPTGGGTGTINLVNGVLEGNYSLVLSMVLNCSSVEQITVTADDASATNRTEQVFCVPDDNDPQVVVRKEAATGANFDFDWDASGGNCVVDAEGTVDLDNDGSFDLDDNDRAEFWCESGVQLVVGEQDDAAFSGISGCTESTEGVDDISGDSVTFDISDLEVGDTATCTWNNGFGATSTAVISQVTSVQVVANPIIACGGTTAVQVTLRNASGGPAPAGTSVTATSSAGGTFQPASTLTGTFPFSFATFLYQAPANFNGVTTITVRTDNLVSGSVNVQVTCGATVAPTVVATAGPLKPPSAGDGGLLGGNSGGSGFGPYLPSTLAAAVAALVLGITLAARRWSAVAVAEVPVAQPVRVTSARSNSGGGFAVLASLALIGVALFLKRRS